MYNLKSSMHFNLYVGNHRSLEGVDDYISLLDLVLRHRGHGLEVTKHLDPTTVNLVIDEFTSAAANHEIRWFRRAHRSVPIILVVTEFVEQRYGVRSFNFFGSVLDAAVIAALGIYLRRRRHDFRRPSWRDWLVAGLYAPLWGGDCLVHYMRALARRKWDPVPARVRAAGYMMLRYLGFEAMIDCADALILSHPSIASGLRQLAITVPVLGVVYPEFSVGALKGRVLVGKRLNIEITGTITRYRQEWIERVNADLKLAGPIPGFEPCQAVPFRRESADFERGNAPRGAYSLHPPQTKRWRYSSPMRIYRSLQHDGSVPVMTGVLDGHPIERLCLVYGGTQTLAELAYFYRNRDDLLELLTARVEEYMSFARGMNDAVVRELVALQARPNNR